MTRRRPARRAATRPAGLLLTDIGGPPDAGTRVWRREFDGRLVRLWSETDGTLYVGEAPIIDDSVIRFLTVRPGEQPVVRAGTGAPAPNDKPLANPIMRVRLGPGDVPYLLDQPPAGGHRILRWDAARDFGHTREAARADPAGAARDARGPGLRA